ncbi:MAG TPA: SRPBCC domain-containing protein [Opitutaceae bacterium]|jgi:uncharacterized protein YndB with AHSA1/START domain
MQTLIVEKEFPHPPEKVWKALSDPQIMSLWLMENDFAPNVGRKFKFRAKPQPNWNGVVDCEVLAVEPPKRLSYAWGLAGPDPAAGFQTVVTWTLAPTTGGTHVRMEQSGFREDQQANYQGAQYGWKMFFGKLETVLPTL